MVETKPAPANEGKIKIIVSGPIKVTPLPPVVVEVELADQGPEGLEPVVEIAAAKGLEVAHVQADLEVGGVHQGEEFQEEVRVRLIDVFQHDRDAVGPGQGGEFLPGDRAPLQPILAFPLIKTGFKAQMADDGHRLEDRQ